MRQTHSFSMKILAVLACAALLVATITSPTSASTVPSSTAPPTNPSTSTAPPTNPPTAPPTTPAGGGANHITLSALAIPFLLMAVLNL